jgi:hypothetical protein
MADSMSCYTSLGGYEPTVALAAPSETTMVAAMEKVLGATVP